MESSNRWLELRDRRIRVPHHVVFRDMAQETVLLNIKTGRYHAIDPVGARFFEVMRSGTPLARVAEALALEYRQPTARLQEDLTVFCEAMLGLGLIDLEAQA
jgi:hypothetical protein